MRSKITIVLLSIFSMLLVTSNLYADDEYTITKKTLSLSTSAGNNEISFNANGGFFSDNSTEKIFLCSDSNLLCRGSDDVLPTREGYDFAGWSKNSNGTYCIDDGVGIYYPDYSKLYACWIQKPSVQLSVPEEGCYYCEDFEETITF